MVLSALWYSWGLYAPGSLSLVHHCQSSPSPPASLWFQETKRIGASFGTTPAVDHLLVLDKEQLLTFLGICLSGLDFQQFPLLRFSRDTVVPSIFSWKHSDAVIQSPFCSAILTPKPTELFRSVTVLRVFLRSRVISVDLSSLSSQPWQKGSFAWGCEEGWLRWAAARCWWVPAGCQAPAGADCHLRVVKGNFELYQT